MTFKYPNGRPMMMDFDRRPFHYGLAQNKSHRRRKYNNRKYHIDGHDFDSKLEVQFYELLKAEKVNFKCHPAVTTIKHQSWKRGGKLVRVFKHRYTPDFAKYDEKGRMIMMYDTKGIVRHSSALSYDHLRMDLATLATGAPVCIVRKRHGRFIFKVRNVK